MLQYFKNFDNDAVNFIDALTSLTEAQRIIINNLVKNLKNAGIWVKMYAIYPVIGGTDTCHKFNIKDPRDIDAAYRLVFNGTITHSSDGMSGNGIDGYYDTKLNDNSVMTLNNVSIWVYARTNVAKSTYDLGAGTSTNATGFNSRAGGDQTTSRCQTSAVLSTANIDSRGFFGVSRLSSTAYQVYKNTTETIKTQDSINKVNANYLGMCFGSGAAYFNTRQQAFAALGLGLTTAEQALFYSIVQGYQTSLGRQV